LSGCPSFTDSEVKRKVSTAAIFSDLQQTIQMFSYRQYG
jgi:hypothetical protein